MKNLILALMCVLPMLAQEAKPTKFGCNITEIQEPGSSLSRFHLYVFVQTEHEFQQHQLSIRESLEKSSKDCTTWVKQVKAKSKDPTFPVSAMFPAR